MSVKLKWAFNLARKIRAKRGSRVRTEGAEFVSNGKVDDPSRPPQSKLFTRIKNLFKRAHLDPVGGDVLQENHNHPKPKSLLRRLNVRRRRVSAVRAGTPQLAERIPSTVILSDQTYVISLSENHHGHSPPITPREGTMAVPPTLQPLFQSLQREGSSFTESDEIGDECESYYTPPSTPDSESPTVNGSVEEDVLALGHGQDYADEEVVASPLADRNPLRSSLAGIENNDPSTSRASLVNPERRIGLISETFTGTASPSSVPEQSPQHQTQTVASYKSSHFSLSRSDTERYPLGQSQTEENPSLSRSQPGGSCSAPSQPTNIKGLSPSRSSSSDACAGSLSQSLTKSSPSLYIGNVFVPTELIIQIFEECVRLPIGCFDGALCRQMRRTCYQLQLVCKAWKQLIEEEHLILSSVAPSSLSSCALRKKEGLWWFTGQIANLKKIADLKKPVVENLSLPLTGDCPEITCRYWGPHHVDLDHLHVLSAVIPNLCRALKVKFPRSFVADWLQADNNITTTTTTEVSIPMSFDTPDRLRYLSWTSNLPLSAPTPLKFQFPWVALRDVQHGLTWSLLTTVELDCPLTIEDCLFVLSKGQENLESVSFRTVDGPWDGEWRSTIKLLRLDSLSVEGIGDLGRLFSFLEMERHRNLGLTSHTRGGEVCVATPSPHALNVRWGSLTHVGLSCHLTRSDLVRLMRGLCDIVSFQWRGHLTPDADTGASIPGAMEVVYRLYHLTEVIVYSNQAGCETILYILIDSHTASLKKIIIDKPVMHFSTPFIPVPGMWDLRSRKLNEMKSALHSLTLNNVEHPISISDAWAILSQCPQLKELDVRVAGRAPPSSWPLARDDTLRSNLQILKLNLDVSVSNLFQNVSLPNLVTLKMTFPNSNRIYARGLDDALKSWGCPLACLVLQNSKLDEETLINCLTSISSTLKDLLIYGVGPQSGCTIGTLALHRLALQEGPDHDLCPKLESLTLEPGVAPDGALAQLLSLKVPPSTCVEKIVPLSGVRGVRISFLKARVPSMAEAREEVLRMIKKLKKTGMDVELVD